MIKKLRKLYNIHTVIDSSGNKHLIEDVILVDVGVMGISNVCLNCLFYEENYTCKYKEREKMSVDCTSALNMHYEKRRL